ncbi:hypothetical protein ACFV2X_38260 [Streptomyces sp. NPDC059679]|uniref:hypothetical protein n=1 Tax=Streptomyces sp. NPDC059679 TaxID=3346903 RepID=UPI0036AFBEC2
MTSTAPLTETPSTIRARRDAARAWYSHQPATPPITVWALTGTPTGQPMLTAQAYGLGAYEALHRFASDASECPRTSGSNGDQEPVMDFSEPGRVSCVWRTGGVWVCLWATESAVSPMVELARAFAGRAA